MQVVSSPLPLDVPVREPHPIEEQFLDRRDGIYWRIGGTFLVD
jgi:hypothetical protein